LVASDVVIAIVFAVAVAIGVDVLVQSVVVIGAQ
jgi:hypothetical protein